MDHKTFNGLLKNVNKAIELASSDPNLPLTIAQRNELIERIQNYEPKLDSEVFELKPKAIALLTTSEVLNFTSTSLGEEVASKTCVVEVHIRQPGFRKRLPSQQFVSVMGNGGNIDPNTIYVNQELLDVKSIAYLEDHRTQFLDWLKSKRVPSGILTPGNGQHLILVKDVEDIQWRLEKFKSDRQELLDRFEASYSDLIERARPRRGKFFSEYDYLPFDEIRAKYKTEYRFISNTVPAELKRVSDALYQSEKLKIKAECEAAALEIRDALRTSFRDLVTHLALQLGVDEFTGRPRRFDSTKVEKLKKFISDFKDLNLSKDEELNSLIEESKGLIEGHSLEDIKKNSGLRQVLEQSFLAIKDKTAGMVITQPIRTFDL